MRHLLGLFGLDAGIKTSFDKMLKDKQDKGFIGRDYEAKINGRKIKMYLPKDVREQYQALLHAEAFLLKELVTSLDNEPLYKNRMALFNLACKNMLVDGREDFDINEFEVDMIDTIIMLYVSELLLPLYQRSSTRAEEALRTSLKDYTEKQ